ncbi:hypothetical protein [Micromonospora sp. NPDC023814]|uniref:hypothetical protein n=1 Tax=Micromonospora sp. NPDC023814 TaxID=3154596 RepID=UPI00340FD10F
MRTRSRYSAPPLSQRQQEELTARRAAERQQELERLYPSPADLVRRHQAEQEDGMRRMLGSSDDGLQWAREATQKVPAASYGPDFPRSAWATKAADRVGRKPDQEQG